MEEDLTVAERGGAVIRERTKGLELSHWLPVVIETVDLNAAGQSRQLPRAEPLP